MFGAFFGNILGKVSLGLLLVAVAACGYLYVEHLGDASKIATDDGTIKTQGQTILDDKGTMDNLRDQLKVQTDLATAAQAARDGTKTATDTLVKKDQTVSQVAHAKVAQIESAYASMPQTADNIAKKDAEVSKTRMFALSSVFCNSYPADASCSGGGVAASAPAAASAASH